MPLFSSGARARLAWRQSSQGNNTCTTNEGVGECTPKKNCPGVSTSGICGPGTDDIECCLVRVCNVSQGHGVCRSIKNNGCDGGEFFPGPNDISCCVKYADFNNGTSTNSSMSMTSSTFTSTPTSAPNTSSATSSSVPPEKGLSGGQIGGIAAGCAVFALLIVLGAIYFFRRRKRSEPHEKKSDTSDSGISEMPDSAGTAPRGPKVVVVSELDGEEKKVDRSVAVNRARELDSTPITSPVELDSSPVESNETKI
ncbi:hypothetical protein McanCB56680_006523 [Microsporum canis]